jgi:hypothetical protein
MGLRFQDFNGLKEGDKLLCLKSSSRYYTEGLTYDVINGGYSLRDNVSSCASTTSLFVPVSEEKLKVEDFIWW